MNKPTDPTICLGIIPPYGAYEVREEDLLLPDWHTVRSVSLEYEKDLLVEAWEELTGEPFDGDSEHWWVMERYLKDGNVDMIFWHEEEE